MTTRPMAHRTRQKGPPPAIALAGVCAMVMLAAGSPSAASADVADLQRSSTTGLVPTWSLAGANTALAAGSARLDCHVVRIALPNAIEPDAPTPVTPQDLGRQGPRSVPQRTLAGGVPIVYRYTDLRHVALFHHPETGFIPVVRQLIC